MRYISYYGRSFAEMNQDCDFLKSPGNTRAVFCFPSYILGATVVKKPSFYEPFKIF